MKRVLITGATGFVGRHLISHLIRHDVEVVAAVRDPARTPANGASRAVHFDLTRPNSLDTAALAGIDCVFHLAALVHVMNPTPEQESHFHALNAAASEALARKCAAAGVRRFVYVSSIKVNGERTIDSAFTANDVPAPEDAYGRSKLEGERLLFNVGRETGLPVTIVRPPLVYGPVWEATSAD